MRTKLISMVIAGIMLLQLGITAFAEDHFDNVITTGKIQVAQSGNAITESTGNSSSVIKASSAPFPKFDFLATLDMKNVRDTYKHYYDDWAEIISYTNPDPAKIAELEAKLNAMKITGTFTIDITYPKSLIIPEEVLTNGNMVGFDENVKQIFGNDTRVFSEGESENTLKIEVKVVGLEEEGRPGYITAEKLMANLDSYLCDFTLKSDGVGTTEYGTFTIKSTMSGKTVAKGSSTTVTVNYATEPNPVTASCSVNRKPSGGGGTVSYTLRFDVDGNKGIVPDIKKTYNSVIKPSDLPIPHRDGYSFQGWYKDAELTEKVTDSFAMTKDTELYGSWKRSKSAGKLNDVEHFAYVIGYPEGDVRPENCISREEIATIFFRLLTDEERAKCWMKTNTFPDVEKNRWSNTAISTMENGGYIMGYEDGSFGPDKYITRAEFATIASRLDEKSDNPAHSFSDISGHWAENYIADAVSKGWIAGYEDGTFRPDAYITRAEAMTIINRMLNRFVDESGLHKDAIRWPDNNPDVWYYYAVEEATNSHDYTRKSDGVYEQWTELLPNRDWAELEKAD